ncbi:helix-hairpin-helix domain-containing protein [Alkalihalobacillus sp. LMS39]|uniref:helix-hairpin-helix domain-containing protein n=1 Tax=Alkalihalobacillus sp. LMS39 TaxID=2924032 RepID=UPI001FB3EC3F|nr:helix-hairpin-helix domain-containing protein [Alkalihalobacillus sp. LMS39]UOE95629.1 helix-hairpin-helix domain-containing protein [Alkalihalobacillus sp. LMS39]
MDLSRREQVFVGVIFILVMICASSLYHFVTKEQVIEKEEWLFEPEAVKTMDEGKGNESEQQEARYVVDVKGAVKRPGIYEANKESRVYHLIDLAGGLSESADETKINLAMKIQDEMIIYVPLLGEEVNLTQAMAATGSQQSGSGNININNATAEELQTLSGIGPSKAAAIITYREEHGPFQTPEDLLKVSGIGPKSLEKLREQIEF